MFPIDVDRDVSIDGDVIADRRMNSNQLSIEVKQWAAGVSADQSAIGYEIVRVDLENLARANRGGSSNFKAAGVPEANSPVTQLQFLFVSKFDEGIIARDGDLDHSGIDIQILAEAEWL